MMGIGNMSLALAELIWTWSNWFLVGALIVGVISTLLIVVSGNVKEAALKRDLAQSRIELEEERQTRLKMEESIAPRMFEQSHIAKALKEFSGTKVIVESLADAETWRTGQQIASTLQMAGWQIVSATRTLDDTDFMDGIEIRSTGPASSEPSLSEKAGEALTKQLEANKIKTVHFRLNTFSKKALPVDTILVRVGLKPATYFMDKLLSEKTDSNITIINVRTSHPP